jgi:hypothetical protein
MGMSNNRYSNRHLLLAALAGAALGYGAFCILLDDTLEREKIIALEDKIRALEQAQRPMQTPADEAANHALDIEQIRKDLSTRFIGDPRSFGEKLRDFVAENSLSQTIPIVCKVVADLAENPDTLTNPELKSLYQNQPNPELKRVLAQVLSLRGDNHLLDQLVAESQAALGNENPAARRQALNDLAKNHYAGAANLVVPVLQDNDLSVVLDALLALRATGNESHIRHVENLVNHPDQSVSWLANDAINHLQNLSTKARTRVTSADIAAQLPPILNNQVNTGGL